jgi:hypothetical protein
MTISTIFQLKDNTIIDNFNTQPTSMRLPIAISTNGISQQEVNAILDLILSKLGAQFPHKWIEKDTFLSSLKYDGNISNENKYLYIYFENNILTVRIVDSISELGLTVYCPESFRQLVQALMKVPLAIENSIKEPLVDTYTFYYRVGVILEGLGWTHLEDSLSVYIANKDINTIVGTREASILINNWDDGDFSLEAEFISKGENVTSSVRCNVNENITGETLIDVVTKFNEKVNKLIDNAFSVRLLNAH